MNYNFIEERTENSSYSIREEFKRMYDISLFYFLIFFPTLWIMKELVENYLLISSYIGVGLTIFLLTLRIFNKALERFIATIHLTFVFSFVVLLYTGRTEMEDYIGYNSIKGYRTQVEYIDTSSFDGTDYLPEIESNRIIEADSWVGEYLVEGFGYLLIFVLGLYLYINFKLY
jgi:hypothetical protein